MGRSSFAGRSPAGRGVLQPLEECGDGALVGRVHRREPEVLDVLGDEHVVDRRARVVGDPGMGALIPVRLGSPALDVAKQQDEMQQRRLDDAPGALHPDVRVRPAREAPDTGHVAHEPNLDVALPQALRDELARARVDPSAREPVVGQLSLGEERRERLEQRPARELVVVDPQDPVARALAVGPAEVPLHSRHGGQDGEAVGEAADGGCDLLVRTPLVEGEEHLVDVRAPRLQQQPHLLGTAGRDDAERQRWPRGRSLADPGRRPANRRSSPGLEPFETRAHARRT